VVCRGIRGVRIKTFCLQIREEEDSETFQGEKEDKKTKYQEFKYSLFLNPRIDYRFHPNYCQFQPKMDESHYAIEIRKVPK
jgi:hypothetical protein